jgi:hypothetical protein
VFDLGGPRSGAAGQRQGGRSVAPGRSGPASIQVGQLEVLGQRSSVRPCCSRLIRRAGGDVVGSAPRPCRRRHRCWFPAGL